MATMKKRKEYERIPKDYESKLAALIVSATGLVIIFLGLVINSLLK
jgi:hypothetical protein